MRMLFTAALAAAVFCAGVSSAQVATQPQSATGQQGSTTPSVSPAGTQANQNPRIAPGSVIPVSLTRSIDAKKAKTGDAVEAKVMQDLKTATGDVIVPRETKVVGHITEVQAHTKEQKESQVGIAFDHAVMKNGEDVPLPMSIQAVVAPPNPNADNGNSADGGMSAPVPMPGSGGMSAGNSGGRPGGMGSGTQQQTPPAAAGRDYPPPSQSANTSAPITANTKGIVGISNLSLSTAPGAAQGSLLSSEKNNVKLESGTLMLLRVNP